MKRAHVPGATTHIQQHTLMAPTYTSTRHAALNNAHEHTNTQTQTHMTNNPWQLYTPTNERKRKEKEAWHPLHTPQRRKAQKPKSVPQIITSSSRHQKGEKETRRRWKCKPHTHTHTPQECDETRTAIHTHGDAKRRRKRDTGRQKGRGK